MATTQYAMVEELASLIKDNLHCKHLVLSTEEALVNFLQDDTSPDGVLELQPVGPYHRLLLHRLADIYGFAHESVGEGDDRHLVLERYPETSIPSILVSDILWQYDEYQSPTPSHFILRRTEEPESEVVETLPSSTPFEEREAAYLAARERIFSLHEEDEKEVAAPKSRKVPVVARRMIAHALGKRIGSETTNQELIQEHQESETTESSSNKEKCEEWVVSTSTVSAETTSKLGLQEKKVDGKHAGKRRGSKNGEIKGHDRAASNGSSKNSSFTNGSNGRVVGTENLEREQIGAAKRIFAHALGLPSGRGKHLLPLKPNGGSVVHGQDV